MNKPSAAAAPQADTPTFADLQADPEIAPLLDFEPVPRQIEKANGWTPAAQRIFIAWLAHYGSPTNACLEVGKARSGIDKIYKAAEADGFRASWDGAVALYEKRRIAQMASRHGGNGALRAPTPSRGRIAAQEPQLLPGQVINEVGEPEDEESVNRRGEEAKDSIARKLLGCRRWYLAEIAASPGKRAAFEILTELPIDWDKAAEMEPQADEPYRTTNQRHPDMILTAESGWFSGFVPYGPDKIGELREAINAERVRRGLPPVTDWTESEDDEPDPHGEVRFHSISRDVPEAHSSLRHSRDGGNPDQESDAAPEGPPAMRSFGLNSQEFYDAVCEPRERPWIPNGSLPREPRLRDPEVIVERKGGGD